MKTRHVLAIDPRGHLSGQKFKLVADDQKLHCVESVDEAKKILARKRCIVGLVIFDSIDPVFQDNVGKLIATASATEWIGVVASGVLADQSLQALMLNAFNDYHTLPIVPERLAMSIGHACGKAMLRVALANSDSASVRFGICGGSPVMKDFFRQLEKVIEADLPVLICGESGTGKELVARAIHKHSGRSAMPFVEVNCGGIPSTLIQTELFGHEPGAFTGAVKTRIGSIEAANGGVLFLDEIGDLPKELQVNLLRVLQERKITRLGATQAISVDFRLVAATHVDLEEAIRAKQFREDLYYRLNVIQLQLPPLRKRGSDIGLLAETILQNFRLATPKCRAAGFTAEAMRAMNAFHWPGNVRELINRIHRGAIMSEGKLLTAGDLGLELGAPEAQAVTLEAARASFERDIVETCLRSNGNNVTKAARQLGVSRVTLYRVMSRLNIEL